MANDLKGITIEIGGDTTGLTDALKSVNKEAKKIQDELKDVEKALKFDPGNTELLKQKQELLTQSIQQTSQKLDTLKTAQAQVQAQFERGEIGAEQYRAFQRELAQTESQLSQYQNTLRSMGAEQERFERAQRAMQNYLNATGQSADDLSSTLGSRLSNAIRDGSASVDQLEMALRRVGQAAGHSGNDLEEFQRTLRNADSNSNLDDVRRDLERIGNEADETGKKIGEGLKKGAKIGAAAIAGIGVAAAGAAVGASAFVESQKEMNMDLARLRTNAEMSGRSMAAIEEGFKKVAAVSGEADSAIEAVSNLMATGFNDNQLAEALDYVNGAAIKFSDTLKTEGIADGIQETFATGAAIGPFAELLERSGVNLDTFNEGLAQAAANGTQADYILQQLSQLGLKETYDAYTQNNQALSDYNQAQLDSQLKLAALATQMQPFVTTLMELGNVVLDVVLGNKSFAEGLDELITIVKGLAEQLFNAAKDAMPKFLKGITDALPKVLEMGSKILNNVIDGIIANFPIWLETAVSLVTNLINKVMEMLPQVQKMGLDLLLKIVKGIIDNLPNIISAAFKIVRSLISGLSQAIPQMINYLLTQFIPAIIRTIIGADWIGVGKSIIEGLINGVMSMASGLIDSIKGVIGGAIEGAKNLLGINSPSKVFMEFGEGTNEGFIKGIERSSKSLYNAMDSVYGSLALSAERSMATSTTNNSTNTSINNSRNLTPTFNIYTTESPEKALNRELRKMAFLL